MICDAHVPWWWRSERSQSFPGAKYVCEADDVDVLQAPAPLLPAQHQDARLVTKTHHPSAARQAKCQWSPETRRKNNVIRQTKKTSRNSMPGRSRPESPMDRGGPHAALLLALGRAFFTPLLRFYTCFTQNVMGLYSTPFFVQSHAGHQAVEKGVFCWEVRRDRKEAEG